MNLLVIILLALAVLAIGLIAAFETFGTASSGASSQAVQQNIQAVFSAVSTDFASSPNNFTGFNTTDAIQTGIVPSGWVPTGQATAVQDPWGGAVTFGVASINGGTNNGWTMTLANVPEVSCSSIGDFYTPQTYEILINGTVIDSNPNYGGATGSWPPPAATIQAACTKTVNTVEWEVSGQ
jgi:hypothetical protein